VFSEDYSFIITVESETEISKHINKCSPLSVNLV